MSDKQRCNILKKNRKDLSHLLNSHVDNLIKSFSQLNLLSETEVAVARKSESDEQDSKVNDFLDIIISKLEKGDGDSCFDELVTFMKGSQDSNLLDLASKMITNQDIDFAIPCGQPVQTESSYSAECEKNQGTHVCIHTCMYDMYCKI